MVTSSLKIEKEGGERLKSCAGPAELESTSYKVTDKVIGT